MQKLRVTLAVVTICGSLQLHLMHLCRSLFRRSHCSLLTNRVLSYDSKAGRPFFFCGRGSAIAFASFCECKIGKQLQIDDVFRLAVVITVKNEDGEYVACTNLHDIHLSDAIGDNIEIGDVRSVEAGGKHYFCTLNVAVDGRVAIVITDV